MLTSLGGIAQSEKCFAEEPLRRHERGALVDDLRHELADLLVLLEGEISHRKHDLAFNVVWVGQQLATTKTNCILVPALTDQVLGPMRKILFHSVKEKSYGATVKSVNRTDHHRLPTCFVLFILEGPCGEGISNPVEGPVTHSAHRPEWFSHV